MYQKILTKGQDYFNATATTVRTFVANKWEMWQELSRKEQAIMAAKVAGLGATVGFILVLILFLAVLFGAFGRLPNATALQKVYRPIASEVYSSDGKLLGKYYVENRTNVSYSDLPSHLIDALVATEDVRFYNHNGVDIRSLFRVFFKTLLLQRDSSGGGSTISQQLAKNLFKRQYHGLLTMPVNKIREMIIATRLERVYDKQDILTLYLNTVSFGEDVYGIDVATQRFFKSEPRNIPIESAAVLVGMLKAPTSYNPRLNITQATNRRNVVMHQMVKYDYLDEAVYDSLKMLPIALDYEYISPSDGLAPYFRQSIRGELKEWCKENKNADGDPYNLYTDGLKIYTTIHSDMQRMAEEATLEHLASLQKTFDQHWKSRKLWTEEDKIIQREIKNSQRYQLLKEAGFSEDSIMLNFKQPVTMQVYSHQGQEEKIMSPLDSVIYYQSFLQPGFIAMEPSTGYIRAWVGGSNHHKFQYDHVKSKRQVGSTFKPIVYAAALQEGVEPCTYFPNRLVTYTEYQNWKPENSDGKYGGEYTMVGGLMNSVNTIAVQLIMEAGLESVIYLAEEMGVKNEIPAVPAIALGAADLSLLEMINVYGTFANRGKAVTPKYLVRIEDQKGMVLEDFLKEEKEPKEVLTEEEADMMTYMLRHVVDSGTAKRLRFTYGLYNQIAGKTGTTQNQTDGWFIGYTPNLVAGAWVGGDQRKVRFRSVGLGQGANMALPIWGKFMQKVYQHPEFKGMRNDTFPGLGEELAYYMDCKPYREEWDTLAVDLDLEPLPPLDSGLQEVLDVFIKNQKVKKESRQSERIRKRNERVKKRREKKKNKKKNGGLFGNE